MNRQEALVILGFKSSANPIESEIKKAFQKSVLKCHPDKLVYPKDATEIEKELYLKEKTQEFQEIQTARDYLLDPSKQNKENEKDNTETVYPMRRPSHIYSDMWGCQFGNKNSKYGIAFSFYQKSKTGEKILNNHDNGDYFFNSFDELIHFEWMLKWTNCFKIMLASDNFIPEGGQKIVDAIKYNPHIFEVKIHGNVLTKNEKEKLDKILYKRNYPEVIKENFNKILKDMTLRFSITGLLLGCCFLYSSITIGIPCAIFGYFLGNRIAKWQHNQLIKASECFELEDERSKKISHAECESIKAGIAAKNWSGYFKSYTNYYTFTQRKSFLAGMAFSLSNDTKIVSKINKMLKKP
ncbi:J domain-containing protein [Candidatus Berkiella cookevillensis]|uniref:Chaperone protein DnaJ n=1 Tax=Candidatus Berkiella cookevillensis TaxID=437022 RepID=A0A0Q9Y9L4_9GAMM|nr:DnaJ domain-containing protein [Candidatus Berkiella cookevillensis]MCS5709793.1 J domain-containing protein [Candidatus Berkiella cookevillensis]